MNSLRDRFMKWMNDLKLKTKLQGLYIVCVLFPLFLMDSIIIYNMVHSEQIENQHGMENIASAVQYNLTSSVESCASLANNIYVNQHINEFLEGQYPSALDYVIGYQDFLDKSFFKSSVATQDNTLTAYADNETIVNGGVFSKISSIKDSPWYKELNNSKQDIKLMFYYDSWQSPTVEPRRKLLFLRKLNFISYKGCEKLLKIEINYSSLVRNLDSMNYESPVYICQNGKVMLTNTGSNNLGQDFEDFRLFKKIGYQKNFTLYGEEFQIYVLKSSSGVITRIKQDLPMLLLLLFISIVLPWILMIQIEQSITVRIRKLGQAFDSVDEDMLKKIPYPEGKDEIGTLMNNYNVMADRTNELIQTVYKDKLLEQEMNIARQNAELQALHSQINPHFLFNALESIRMHSILKEEFETADMVQKLAVMERQNVNWGTDNVKIKDEMDFVRAYLSLQKYRFGDRLSFELEVDPECEDIPIPKLTVVTFVENACVHGIESKTAPGWIFVRINMVKEELCIEIEDTGEGMPAQMIADVRDRMQDPSIEKLQEKGSVGILNACLRIKMVYKGTAKFSIESEDGVGTMIQIRIPMKQEINN